MPPRVFISYTHESDEHRRQVRQLSQQLRHFGVDCWLDQYDEVPPPDSWPQWMFGQIDSADFVLVICTATYRRRVEGREQPGVGLGAVWEGGIVTQALYESPPGSPVKFIPVLLPDAGGDDIPYFLRATTHYRVVAHEVATYEKLLEHLLGRPRVVPAPLGAPPADLASLRLQPPDDAPGGGTRPRQGREEHRPARPARADDPDLPNSVGLDEVLGAQSAQPDVLASRWSEAPRTAPVPVGRGTQGVVTWDPVTEGPHALVAGMTGTGKTTLLRTMLGSIAAIYPPDAWQFVLIDYLGGSAFRPLVELPHTLTLVTDLDGYLVRRAGDLLAAELDARAEHLRRRGKHSYDELSPEDQRESPLPRLMIVVDEIAGLRKDHPAFLDGLVQVGRLGRSLGVHLVMSTQRANAIPDALLANTNARFVLRTTIPGESARLLGNESAADIPRRPGRALKVVHAAHAVAFQAAIGREWLTDVVRAAGEASVLRPTSWPEASLAWRGLPPVVPAGNHTLPPGTVGLVDDPAHLTIRPWQLDPERPRSLHVVGTRGSGKSTTLASCARAWCQLLGPEDTEIYVIGSANRGHLHQLRSLPQVRVVLGPEDVERLLPLVRLALSEARRRTWSARFAEGTPGRDGGTLTEPGRRVVVIVDDAHLLAEEHPDLLPALDDLAAAATPETRMALVISTDLGGASASYCQRLQHRVVLRLSDPGDYEAFGITSEQLPSRPPAGRGVLLPEGYALQVVDPTDGRPGLRSS